MQYEAFEELKIYSFEGQSVIRSHESSIAFESVRAIRLGESLDQRRTGDL
jgi:hypothetical protein